MNSFIPSFHFQPPSTKLTPEWCEKAVQYYFFNTNNRSLLHDKRVKEIDDYASGKIPMEGFKRMYKSMKKKLQESQLSGQGRLPTEIVDDSDLLFTPIPLIPTPLNSAISILQKIPVEVSCTALDPLAATKKKEDVTFLKNKPAVESDLKSLTDKMNISPIDLGSTQHSSVPFGDSPYGFDLNDPGEYDVFVNLLYKLGVESCFETALQIWWEIKKANQIKLLEIRDQFKYGVSCNDVFDSSITGLPDIEYKYPGKIHTPYSELPDYGDRTHQYEEMRVTPMDLFNYFSDEIPNEGTLAMIINGSDKTGYCSCNGYESISQKNFSSFKVNLIKFQVRSVDYVNVVGNPKSKKSFIYLAADDEVSDTTTIVDKIWGQNTYVFYWLKNTKYYFGISRLGYSHRSPGNESYQNFTTNIYKSQEKSAVENSIGENRKAQIADIKMQYAIIQSRPSGIYIDLKYLRGALAGLADGDDKKTLDELTQLALEKNIIIGDSEGMDGTNAGQFKPFQEIVGGIRSEVDGYMKVVQSAKFNIASFTGINQQLTGQSENDSTLIGLEKLRINASINALNYSNEAIQVQYQNVFNQWGYSIKNAINKGGKPKEALVGLIGSRKVDIVKRIDEMTLHNMGIKVSLTLREEERARFDQKMYKLESQGVITAADIYLLDYIPNIKDRFALLAIKEKQWMQKQDQIRQQNYIQQQQLLQQQGQNAAQQEDASTQGGIKKIYAKGDVESKKAVLQNQLDTNSKKYDAVIQQSLQEDRNQGQIQKAVESINAKKQADAQTSLI